jgi:hypothetical protein
MVDAVDIPLLRGGRMVSSLAGAFGHALRETRLTGMLGFIIAHKPEIFREAFELSGIVSGVALEEGISERTRGRCDIRIETSQGICVVEAKVNTIDPRKQCSRYPADWRVLLTNHIPCEKSRRVRNVIYISWEALAKLLKNISSQRTFAGFVSSDLITHLEEHNMIKKDKGIEIYAREINETTSLDLFLKARIYRCWYKEGSRLPEALYFAPHFGYNLAAERPGIQVGISYVARIETVEVVETWEEFRDAVRTTQGAKALREHKAIFDETISRNRKERLSIVFLGKPRLVFNPPVRKENIQEGSGWLSKRFLTFEELFEAWGGR